MDLSGLDSIEIDEGNMLANCGPGAVVEDLQKKASAVGLFYPPDPSSKKFCTIFDQCWLDPFSSHLYTLIDIRNDASICIKKSSVIHNYWCLLYLHHVVQSLADSQIFCFLSSYYLN